MATIAPAKEAKTYRWPPQGEWTYDDYARLPDSGVRYEVIGGDLFMSPAPSTEHQNIIFELILIIGQFVKANQLGQVFVSPVDLVLPDRATPVQPDLLFIGNDKLDIIKEKVIKGAPDLIVEVLSPSNPEHDRRTKFSLYAEAGVREYWIVDPKEQTVDVFALRGQAYVPFGHFGAADTARSELLPELEVALEEVWGER